MTISKRVQKELFQAGPITPPVEAQATVPRRHVRMSKAQRVAAEQSKGKAWTAEEHERFLKALEKYPSGPWKAIAEFVGSKNSRQTMTHAQKYRQKFERRQRGLRSKSKSKKSHKTQRATKPPRISTASAEAPPAPVQTKTLTVPEPPVSYTESPRSGEESASRLTFHYGPLASPKKPNSESTHSITLGHDGDSSYVLQFQPSVDQLMAECFAEYEPTDYPELWSTNSLEELVCTGSQLDLFSDSAVGLQPSSLTW